MIARQEGGLTRRPVACRVVKRDEAYFSGLVNDYVASLFNLRGGDDIFTFFSDGIDASAFHQNALYTRYAQIEKRFDLNLQERIFTQKDTFFNPCYYARWATAFVAEEIKKRTSQMEDETTAYLINLTARRAILFGVMLTDKELISSGVRITPSWVLEFTKNILLDNDKEGLIRQFEEFVENPPTSSVSEF